MSSDREDEYQELALIIILSGCGIAIAFAILVCICCHFLVKPKHSKFGRSQPTNSHRVFVYERQTTTSDENNDFSYCDDSISAMHYHASDSIDIDDDENMESPSTVIQTHIQDQAAVHDSVNNHHQPSNRPSQVTFAPKKPKNRKASLPCKILSQQLEESKVLAGDGKNTSDLKVRPQRRASAGIIRQKSFEECIEEVNEPMNSSNSSNSTSRAQQLRSNKGSIEIGSGNGEAIKSNSPDAVRKQYKELWTLRTTFEQEELDEDIEMSQDVVAPIRNSPPEQQQQPRRGSIEARLSKNDSGYKSIERKDYSIDYKTESIYREFTSSSSSSMTTPIRHQSIHQSIKEEEQENEMQATFV